MDALLFVSHIINPGILIKFRQLSKAFAKYGDCYMVLEENRTTCPHMFLEKYVSYFNWEKLKSMGYTPITDKIVPGSNHFVTLSFFNSKSSYDNYWSIEYDVEFLGDWSCFFNRAYGILGDFVSCHLQCYLHNPSWYWWKSYHCKNPQYDIPINKRIRSFNPIYRISKEALRFLDFVLKNGVSGHHEVVIPSLLYHNKFKISDFGGFSDISLKHKNDGLYINKSKFSLYGSMQHIPFSNLSCFVEWENVLVHPVKLL